MSFTIDEWCKHRRIGRWKLYEFWKQGRGPRFYMNGPRRLISDEADADWIKEQEAAAQTPAGLAALERATERGRAIVRAKRGNAEAA